jgi:hypothetical protein
MRLWPLFLLAAACRSGAPQAQPPASASTSPPPTPTPTPPPTASATAPSSPSGDWSPALLARLTREADARPAGKLDEHPAPDAERDRAIRKTFGERCHLERTCGPLWGVDCGAAVDLPYYYLRPRADHVERVATCGGVCMGGRCTACPPRAQGWTCPPY